MRTEYDDDTETLWLIPDNEAEVRWLERLEASLGFDHGGPEVYFETAAEAYGGEWLAIDYSLG